MESTEEQIIKNMVDKAEVSLILDTYDDIFSDFDPRPYNQRILSEDFISEAKKAARDKTTGIELQFMIPQQLRNERSESLIKQRLKDYFKKNYKRIKAELSRQEKRAMVLIGVGVVIGFSAVFLLSSSYISTIIKYTVEIVLTPASWYTVWTGFDGLIVKPKDLLTDKEFYRKMAGADITFTSY